jgi:hypothetical protein
MRQDWFSIASSVVRRDAARVPEVLGCFTDRGVLVTGAAPGVCLTMLAEDPRRWEEGLRGAAAWLARLHSLSMGPGGTAEDQLNGLFRLARRATRAAAKHAVTSELMVGLIEEVAARAGSLPGALVYHWSYSILSTLFRLLELGHAKWEKRLKFYSAEFDDVPRRADSLRRLATVEAVP